MKLKTSQGNKKENKKDTEKREEMEDYYKKERPRPQDMEQAEGDEDIVDTALAKQDQRKNRNAA